MWQRPHSSSALFRHETACCGAMAKSAMFREASSFVFVSYVHTQSTNQQTAIISRERVRVTENLLEGSVMS